MSNSETAPAVSDMYWENYDDQLTEDFEYIGVEGCEEIEPLTDIESQVKEIYRLHGRRTAIRVYRRGER